MSELGCCNFSHIVAIEHRGNYNGGAGSSRLDASGTR